MIDPTIVTGISDDPLDIASLVEQIRRPDCGAVVTFEGTTRSPNDGVEVLRLHYETWRASAEPHLRNLAREAAERWDLGGVAVVHRVGDVAPGETSVVVSVVAAHRGEAFEAARWLIDTLKEQVAIWKQEVTGAGATWVDPTALNPR